MGNNESLKVSKKGKEFLSQIMINRIKLDQKPLKSFSETIELIQKYFKINNDQYLKMLKEESKNV
jgi:hypothetical protein